MVLVLREKYVRICELIAAYQCIRDLADESAAAIADPGLPL